MVFSRFENFTKIRSETTLIHFRSKNRQWFHQFTYFVGLDLIRFAENFHKAENRCFSSKFQWNFRKG